MLGGRLPETRNKRKCQISGLKSGRGRSRNSSSGRFNTRHCLKQYLTEKQIGSLRSGRYERVDCNGVFGS